MAQWVVHLVLAPEVQAAAAEVGAQGATAEQVEAEPQRWQVIPFAWREPLNSVALVRVEPWQGYLLLWAAVVSRNTYPPNLLFHQGRSIRAVLRPPAGRR